MAGGNDPSQDFTNKFGQNVSLNQGDRTLFGGIDQGFSSFPGQGAGTGQGFPGQGFGAGRFMGQGQPFGGGLSPWDYQVPQPDMPLPPPLSASMPMAQAAPQAIRPPLAMRDPGEGGSPRNRAERDRPDYRSRDEARGGGKYGGGRY